MNIIFYLLVSAALYFNAPYRDRVLVHSVILDVNKEHCLLICNGKNYKVKRESDGSLKTEIVIGEQYLINTETGQIMSTIDTSFFYIKPGRNDQYLEHKPCQPNTICFPGAYWQSIP